MPEREFGVLWSLATKLIPICKESAEGCATVRTYVRACAEHVGWCNRTRWLWSSCRLVSLSLTRSSLLIGLRVASASGHAIQFMRRQSGYAGENCVSFGHRVGRQAGRHCSPCASVCTQHAPSERDGAGFSTIARCFVCLSSVGLLVRPCSPRQLFRGSGDATLAELAFKTPDWVASTTRRFAVVCVLAATCQLYRSPAFDCVRCLFLLCAIIIIIIDGENDDNSGGDLSSSLQEDLVRGRSRLRRVGRRQRQLVPRRKLPPPPCQPRFVKAVADLGRTPTDLEKQSLCQATGGCEYNADSGRCEKST